MKMTTLNKVCNIQNGFAFKSKEYLSEGIPLLRISNIVNDRVYFNGSSVYVDENYLNTKSDFVVEKGDVVIALSGATTGKYGIYELEYPSLLNQRLGLIKSNKSENLDSRYFYYYLGKLKSEIFRKAGGAAQPNISTRELGRFEIPLPPLKTQQKIAAILDDADRLRQLDKQLIKKYEQLSQSLFLEMFGDPVSNPKNFDVQSLSSITTKIGSGATPKGGKEAYFSKGISLIRSLNVHNNRFKYKNLAFIDEEQAYRLRNVIVEENDVLFNITGASVCRTAIVPKQVLPARVNQHVAIIRLKNNMVYPIFLSHLLTSSNFQNKLEDLASKGGATRQAINKAQLENIQIPIPNMQLQLKFIQAIELLNNQKTQAQKSLKHSDELFNGLLQRAFKGELV